MKKRLRLQEDGFTLIELLIVVAIIGIIVAVAVPGLIRARMSGNEASGIGSVHTIGSAQSAYASSCGAGGYAVSMAALAAAPASGGLPFIPADLAVATAAASAKSGYVFAIAPTGTGATVTPGADTCNNAATAAMTEFFATGTPAAPGSTGVRYFAINQSGLIRQHTAVMATIADGIPLQ